MQVNRGATAKPVFTHEGAKAYPHLKPIQELRRSVLSCLLWEDQFYENGASIADRIVGLCDKVNSDDLANLAVDARSKFNLRHVPLLLACRLAKKGGKIVSDTVEKIIQRPDELSEILAVYWRDGKKPISKQLKLGIGRAFRKFDGYSLAKYNRDKAIKLRDVLFLTHPKAKDEEQQSLWNKLANNALETPDTWEVELSSGKNKKETFERLMREGKLGYLALLRNLRNMEQSGVDRDLIRDQILARKGANRVFPFRFVAAARACPSMERHLDRAMIESIKEIPPFSGKTVVLVDVSGSMDAQLSGKSDMTRIDAACALASLIDGNIRVYSFSEMIVEVPHRLGMAGVDAIRSSQAHSGTYLGNAIGWLNANIAHDRLIVITDEQSHDRVPDPICENAYMINVASHKNGIGYGKWTHIDGFSEGVLRYIREVESLD